jgi:hypothetical protein
MRKPVKKALHHHCVICNGLEAEAGAEAGAEAIVKAVAVVMTEHMQLTGAVDPRSASPKAVAVRVRGLQG